MRTAEEILEQEWDCKDGNLQVEIILNSDVDKIIKAINIARKEAIEECARLAEAYPNALSKDFQGIEKGIVNKQSILKLIDELK